MEVSDRGKASKDHSKDRVAIAHEAVRKCTPRELIHNKWPPGVELASPG
jgi:hypothetical protein